MHICLFICILHNHDSNNNNCTFIVPMHFVLIICILHHYDLNNKNLHFIFVHIYFLC